MQRLSQRAFTLIELLIVVAIIAILAAIAVPNFLEAQVRSKISRAKADLRSIGSALESYAVDHSAYPKAGYYASDYAANYPATYYVGRGGVTVLTTPVAYITCFPTDPFPAFQIWTSSPPGGIQQLLGMKGRPYFYDNMTAPMGGTGGGNFEPERRMGLKWCCFSAGPSRGPDALSTGEGAGRGWYYFPARRAFPSKMRPYDATNGTFSNGAIARYGPGGEIDRFDPER